MNIFGHEINAVSMVDVAQLVQKFLGGSEPRPTVGEGKGEKPPEQQTTSLLKPNFDEAIHAALDATLGQMANGMAYLKNIQLVLASLEPHQQASWREKVASYNLPPRFSQEVVSRTTTPVGRGGQQNIAGAAQAQPQVGPSRVDEKFERQSVAYELTPDDSRIKHLILVAKIVDAENEVGDAKPLGVARAKAYLHNRGFFSSQSPTEKAAAAARQGEEMAASAINRYVADMKSDDADLIRLEAAIKAAGDAAAKRQAEEALRVFLAAQSRAANARRQEKDAAAKLRFRTLIVIVVIVVITMAAIV